MVGFVSADGLGLDSRFHAVSACNVVTKNLIWALCIRVTVTWYKIYHAEEQATYKVKFDYKKSPCFRCPRVEYASSKAGSVPFDR